VSENECNVCRLCNVAAALAAKREARYLHTYMASLSCHILQKRQLMVWMESSMSHFAGRSRNVALSSVYAPRTAFIQLPIQYCLIAHGAYYLLLTAYSSLLTVKSPRRTTTRRDTGPTLRALV
jgi:hypothetical protein